MACHYAVHRIMKTRDKQSVWTSFQGKEGSEAVDLQINIGISNYFFADVD